jgi:hypothetical protein
VTWLECILAAAAFVCVGLAALLLVLDARERP